ncbi:Uncharacterised protein [uncultured archaeon]|nr:Uncharacterised protein [uncultured archaeon]
MPYCQACGSMIDEYDSGYYARNMLCIPCYGRKSSEVESIGCARCGTRVRKYESRERQGRQYCNYCYNELSRVERLPVCLVCHERIEGWQKAQKLPDGRMAHESCLRERKGDARRLMEEGERKAAKEGEGSGTILGAVMNKIVSVLR